MTTHLRMDESTTRTIQNRTESSSNIEVAYEEMIPTEASHMDRYNVEDQTVWRLINLIGLVMFLAAVIGPIAYVTFCCRRPITDDGPKCAGYLAKIMACHWCRHQLLRRRTRRPEFESLATDRCTSTRSAHDPPSYLAALSMPRLEDNIKGTPPPAYNQLFKSRPGTSPKCRSQSAGVRLSSVNGGAGNYRLWNTRSSSVCFTDLPLVSLVGSPLGEALWCESGRRRFSESPAQYYGAPPPNEQVSSPEHEPMDDHGLERLPSYEEGLLILKTSCNSG